MSHDDDDDDQRWRTVSVTAFAVKKSNCERFAGKFVGCTVTAATPKTLPYSVTVGTSTPTVRNLGVTHTFNAGCAISKVESSYPELTLTPEEPSAIQFFHFGQTGTGKVNGVSASITDAASGSCRKPGRANTESAERAIVAGPRWGRVPRPIAGHHRRTRPGKANHAA